MLRSMLINYETNMPSGVQQHFNNTLPVKLNIDQGLNSAIASIRTPANIIPITGEQPVTPVFNNKPPPYMISRVPPPPLQQHILGSESPEKAVDIMSGGTNEHFSTLNQMILKNEQSQSYNQ